MAAVELLLAAQACDVDGFAAVAQWIEYWPPKPRVVGSIPASRANIVDQKKSNKSQIYFELKKRCYNSSLFGGVAEWLKAADCKSAR